YQEIGESRRGDGVQVRRADGYRLGSLEVRGQLVQQQQDGLSTQQLHPVGVARRLQRAVEVLEDVLATELLGDLAPDTERRVRLAAAEGHDAHASHRWRVDARRLEHGAALAGVLGE